MANAVLRGKPDAGNPHVRFDEGEVASCIAAIETEGRNSPSIAQGLPKLRRVHCRRQPEGRASVCAATPRRGSLLYRKMITVAAIAASAVVSSPSLAVAKETTLALAGYTGTTTLTNFQALVKLSEGRFGFSYDDYAAKDGTDLWFADSS